MHLLWGCHCHQNFAIAHLHLCVGLDCGCWLSPSVKGYRHDALVNRATHFLAGKKRRVLHTLVFSILRTMPAAKVSEKAGGIEPSLRMSWA